MKGYRTKVKVAFLVIGSVWIALAALYGVVKPISNGCVMTYMYPTYIPISAPQNVSSLKYGLYLYHEGWKKIDFSEHLKKLSGVPVLFIPGNGGSYKQVRSLAAESDRAYQGGPLEHSFYQEASLSINGGESNMDVAGLPLLNQYTSMLDWFAVDLDGEHSAMDGQILEEHTEYVVYAIHRILDKYKESHDARLREGAAVSIFLPKSVILVGHSMGGFVARAAIVHPSLRKSAVETVLTLSTAHQSPPVALQPSLGQYYAHVNQRWRKGYELQVSQTGDYMTGSVLSHVVVVSISGGYHDYQVRTMLESLDGIVPPSHGFMISSTEMKNVLLSMEHQVILWCNQLVVQVSHTLLSLINSKAGQPFSDVQRRLAVFTRMLRSGIPKSFNSLKTSQLHQQSPHALAQNGKDVSQMHRISACPSNVDWSDDGLERDLYIQTNTVTVLAMDGRRRWLDIPKLGSNGRSHFVFVSNLDPCSGVRLHLWPEKGISASDLPGSRSVLEVTSKMVQIPSGPAPRQIEPGSQTEQPPPSAVFWLNPEDMRGYRFLTISVAPRPTVAGRPPPVASMAVGQFFNPREGEKEFSSHFLLRSMYAPEDMILKEDHPLALDLSFSISVGLLPVNLSLKTTGCGIKNAVFFSEDASDVDSSRICKLRCFPPVALVWDATSGLHVFPNLHSETILVDSAPAFWSPTQGSEMTTALLLVDPHCSYTASIAASFTNAASRFLLLYCPQIIGFSIAVVLFALMRQAHSWELDQPVPSVLSAIESNIRIPFPFLFLALFPIVLALFLSCLCSEPLPAITSFIIVSIICYLFANGSVLVVILISHLVFYVAASLHVFIKKRWHMWERNFCFLFLHWFLNLSSGFLSFKVVRIIKINRFLVTALIAIMLVCLVHPAFGLFVLFLSHAFCCHNALSSSLTASFGSHVRNRELLDYINEGGFNANQNVFKYDLNRESPFDKIGSNNPDSARSYEETQLEIFHHRHGLLILHLFAALMFVPSLIAWLQRIRLGQSFPWFLDSALCTGVILHGICDSQPEFNFFLFPFPGIRRWEFRLSTAYLLAGYYSYLSGLALAPYRAFYAMATIGVGSFVFRIIQRRNRDKGEAYYSSRKHSHRN